jgi:hypothetical protein
LIIKKKKIGNFALGFSGILALKRPRTTTFDSIDSPIVKLNRCGLLFSR